MYLSEFMQKITEHYKIDPSNEKAQNIARNLKKCLPSNFDYAATYQWITSGEIITPNWAVIKQYLDIVIEKYRKENRPQRPCPMCNERRGFTYCSESGRKIDPVDATGSVYFKPCSMCAGEGRIKGDPGLDWSPRPSGQGKSFKQILGELRLD